MMKRSRRPVVRRERHRRSWAGNARPYVLGASLLLVPTAWAGTPGSSAGDVLHLTVGPRAAAMGGTLLATGEGAAGLEGNPAALGWTRSAEGAAMHAEWLGGVRFESLSAAARLGRGAAGAHLAYLHAGDLPKRDALGTDLGLFSYRDVAVRAGYGWRAGHATFGGALMMLSESIDDVSGAAVGVDLGAQVRVAKPLTFGAAIQNLGTKLSLDRTGVALPIIFRGGLALRLKTLVTKREAFALALEGEGTTGSDPDLRAGLELWPFRVLAFRAGYRTRFFEGALGGLTGFAAGLGLRLAEHLTFDYAFAPFGLQNGLGLTHRASIGIRLGAESPAKPAAMPPAAVVSSGPVVAASSATAVVEVSNATAAGVSAPGRLQKIAVLDFGGTGADAATRAQVTERIVVALSMPAVEGRTVLGRAERDAGLAAREIVPKSAEDAVSPKYARKAGKALGLTHVIVGRVEAEGEARHLAEDLIDVKSGETIGAESIKVSSADLLMAAAERLAQRFRERLDHP